MLLNLFYCKINVKQKKQTFVTCISLFQGQNHLWLQLRLQAFSDVPLYLDIFGFRITSNGVVLKHLTVALILC